MTAPPDLPPADESDAYLLERRWFAAGRAAAEIESECDMLVSLLDSTQAAWRQARARLAQLKALHDALGEELAAI